MFGLTFVCSLLLIVINVRAADISYLERGGILEKDIAAIFNKVAYGGVTTTKRSIASKFLPVVASPTTTLPPPLTSIAASPPAAPTTTESPAAATTETRIPVRSRQDLTARNQNGQFTTNLPPFLAPKTAFPLTYTTPAVRAEVPSYVPPVRSFFTPPLPPEYANPFADKPTLRGSNAEVGTGPGRRPPPPIAPPSRERIPLRPPDLAPDMVPQPPVSLQGSERKKPLNTPSLSRAESPPYDRGELDTPSTKSGNDTDFDFVPILQYPAVSRILSGSNGRKDFPEIHRPRIEARPRTPEPPVRIEPVPPQEPERPVRPERPERPERPVVVEPVDYDSNVDDSKPPGIPASIDIESKLESSPEPAEPAVETPAKPPEPADENRSPIAPSRKTGDESWKLAWNVHVFSMATVFLILAIVAVISLARINACKRLLGHGYYIAIHSFLFLVGSLRSFYLFLDPYNVNGTLPKPFSDLVLNVVPPLITSAFLVLFLFVLKASKADVLTSRLRQPFVCAVFCVAHVFLSASFELSAELRPELRVLPLADRCVYVVVLVVLGSTYLYAYREVASAARKADSGAGRSLTGAARAGMGAAMLALLMAVVQLAGVFAVPGAAGAAPRSQQWLWWGFTFSVRLIEASMCFLMAWAAVQPVRCRGSDGDEKGSDSSGFALFSCGPCSQTPRSAEDDIYPAVCATNQAIHDYTLRTGKKVYDDYPLTAMHSALRPRPESPSHYEEPLPVSDMRSLRSHAYHQHQSGDIRAPSNYGYEGGGGGGRFSYDDSDFSTNERRSRHDAPMKKSGTFDCATTDRRVPGGGGRGSLRRGGATLQPDRRNVHRAATLNATNRDRGQPGASMLVAENGFVRFRTLQEPEEVDSDEGLMVAER